MPSAVCTFKTSKGEKNDNRKYYVLRWNNWGGSWSSISLDLYEGFSRAAETASGGVGQGDIRNRE